MADDGDSKRMADVVPLHSEPAFDRAPEVSDFAALERIIRLQHEQIRTRLDLISDKLDRFITRQADENEDIHERLSQVERRGKVKRK